MSGSRTMEFKEKVETVIAPLVGELRQRLAHLPTSRVLNHYQLLINSVQTDKSEVPDGFIFKWRYLWMLLLSNPYVDKEGEFEPEFKKIDHLIEEIFQTYGLGAIYEPGRSIGSEKEFLTRLGLAIKVREPDTLAFPEQIREWASKRLQPFNDSFFVPTFGMRFEEIMGWIGRLVSITESRLNASVREFTAIVADIKSMQAGLTRKEFNLVTVRTKADELRIGERLKINSEQMERIHIFSAEELLEGVPSAKLQTLIRQFGIRPGEITTGCVYPHDENPLEYKLLVAFPSGGYYFLDPANAYRIAAKTFERELLAEGHFRERYLKNRDRETEQWVAKRMKNVFSDTSVFSNYYLERGTHEKDVLVHHEDCAVLIECKNTRVRTFKGTAGDLLKFEKDFGESGTDGTFSMFGGMQSLY